MRKVKCKFWDREIKSWNEGSGLFHQWGVQHEELRDGVGNYTVAIIELSDGSIVEALPTDVQFLQPDEQKEGEDEH